MYILNVYSKDFSHRGKNFLAFGRDMIMIEQTGTDRTDVR